MFQLSEFPAPGLLFLLWMPGLVLLLVPAYRRFALLPLIFAFGFSWATFTAWLHLYPQLMPELEGKPLLLTGSVASLPQREGRILRFVLEVESAQDEKNSPALLPRRVRLAWYGKDSPQLLPGERWQLRVKLKRPWSLRNPGSFDYEEWLFQQGIRATGYVREDRENRRLAMHEGYSVLRLRYEIGAAITARLGEHPMAGIIMALAIGERSGISDEQWNVLLASGTNHLVAISGLHIGLVAGMAYFLALRFWRFCPRCCEWLAAPRAAALFGMLAAFGYAALAGFSIPTQRALLMLAIVLGAVWWRRPIERGRVLLLALWAVSLLDPASVRSAGFWLSFAAVAWILYGMGGRWRAEGLWWRWGRVQLLVALGLLPLLLLFFQQGSLSAPLANLLAVPLVSLLVVPLTLLGVLLLGPWPWGGGMLLTLAASLMDGFWPLLEWLAEVIPVISGSASGWTLLPAVVGLIWLLAPQGWPLRSLGTVLLLPLLLRPADAPEAGSVRLTLLDVGQGLAAVVQTQHHTLLFDAGPAYASGFDTGDAVVVPFMRQIGVKRIDKLVVSHGNNDHAGGVSSVRQHLTVERILADTEVAASLPDAKPCQRGSNWQWDGVAFRVLHPVPGPHTGDENNHSCVLRVSVDGHAILLAADIEAGGERELLASGEVLKADVLLVPHHGSNTSSSEDFIDAVGPQLALFSLGYRNRYGFPHAAVLSRYASRSVSVHRTDAEGALQLDMNAEGPGEVSSYRIFHRRLWHGNM